MSRKPPQSHGTGLGHGTSQSYGTVNFDMTSLASFGSECVIEDGVRIFHPENVHLGDRVYVGHDTMLKGYFKNELRIGDGTWIGQRCFMHAAAGIIIGKDVGIGPGAMMLTSQHKLEDATKPILHQPLSFAPINIEDGADIGAGAVILPGVRIGKNAQIGAGAVVTKDVDAFSIAVGNPAKKIRNWATQ